MSANSARMRGETGAFIVDRTGTVLGFDHGMEALTGWPAAAVVGRHKQLGCLIDPSGTGGGRLALPLYEGELSAPEKGASRRELKLSCRDGSAASVEVRIERLAGPGERVVVKVLRVLSRSAASEAIRTLEDHDPLTGLLDRAAFLSRLDAAFARSARQASPLALIVADIDHLRAVNDQLGREHGNDVLRKLAGILRVTVGDESRLGRLGDDEFGVLMPDAGRGDARQLAAALRTTTDRFQFFDRRDRDFAPKVTLSIGAASFPADADGAGDLVDRAYDALEEARSFGRNRVWCYVRRPRVPLEVPVYFDGAEALLVGYTRDLSPSGIFVQTSAPIEIGMRCALAFPLPGHDAKVHVIGRVVRAVPPDVDADDVRIPGMGVEFERFGGPKDRRAIEGFLHMNEARTLRPENGRLSVPE